MRIRTRSARHRAALAAGVLSWALLHATAGSPARSFIRAEDLQEWVAFLASDELEGRGNYSEGLERAAAYIQDHLRSWGVRPAGDGDGYLQTVRVMTVKPASRSTITVQIGSETRTFKDGDGIRFPRHAGGTRRFTVDRVEFAGYGIDAPGAGSAGLRAHDFTASAFVWLGPRGPKAVDASLHPRALASRGEHAVEDLRALAAIGPEMPDAVRGATDELVLAGRLDLPRPPAVAAGDGFFEFLFSKAPGGYRALKRKAEDGEPLPAFRLDGVRITFNIDVDYPIVRTRLMQNVVGLVEGGDPQLRSTYVSFGAHYDHVGRAEAGAGGTSPGRVTPEAAHDRIWNGADDNATGTAAVMALARAFSAGPRPGRSALFVWHAGEEIGYHGSRHFTDYPPVPIDAVVAQLNIDMIGRNRNDQPAEANSVYLVGSDRISSELHEISKAANRELDPPLTLDFEMNDPADPEQLYYRSDHYSYALKGIPVIFFTTGLHPDYHANTDDVSKILFDKAARVTQLIYETGMRIANLDHAPVRDWRGPRAGKGSSQ
jgi:hypothetical protein